MTIDPDSHLLLHHQQQRERNRRLELALEADVSIPISRSGQRRSADVLGAFGPRRAAIGRPSWWSRTEGGRIVTAVFDRVRWRDGEREAPAANSTDALSLHDVNGR